MEKLTHVCDDCVCVNDPHHMGILRGLAQSNVLSNQEPNSNARHVEAVQKVLDLG